MFAEGGEEPIRTRGEASALRWWVRASVLGAVLAWLPFYAFVLGVSATNLYFSYPIGALAAVVAAEVGLTVFVRRWKRSVYPSFVIKELNEATGLASVARRASSILRELLNVHGAFLTFKPPEGHTDDKVVASDGIEVDSASVILAQGSEADGMAVQRDGRLVLLPLRSMDSNVGMLGLMNGPLFGDTGDEELLAGLAYAIGSKLSSTYTDEALRASEKRYRTLIDTTPDAIFLTSIDGRIVLCNSSAARIHGFGRAEELVGQFALDLVGLEDRNRFQSDLGALLRSGVIGASEYRFIRRDGQFFPGEMRASVVTDDLGTPVGILQVHRDVSERKNAEQTIRTLAYYDSLTGLKTRARFLERLRTAVESGPDGTALALMFIDLDGFKQINDEFGHDAGDAVLKTVSRRLAALMRKGDTAGRLGGDELVAVLPGVASHEEARRIAQQLLSSIRQPIPADGQIYRVTASIGIALFPEAASGVIELMRAADKAMYAAKRAGGDRFEVYGARPATV